MRSFPEIGKEHVEKGHEAKSSMPQKLPYCLPFRYSTIHRALSSTPQELSIIKL